MIDEDGNKDLNKYPEILLSNKRRAELIEQFNEARSKIQQAVDANQSSLIFLRNNVHMLSKYLISMQTERDTLRAELDKLKQQKPEPVGFMDPRDGMIIEKSIRDKVMSENRHLSESDSSYSIAVYAHPVPPQQVPELTLEDEQLKRNLAMMIRRLSGSLLHYKPDSTIPRQAMEFLSRHNLQGSPLRKTSEDADFCAPNSIDDSSPATPSDGG